MSIFLALAPLIAQYGPQLAMELYALLHKPDGTPTTPPVDQLNALMAKFAAFKANTLADKEAAAVANLS